MNTKNRILSLVLALVMIFGAFAPAVAQAQTGEGKEQGIVEETSPLEVTSVVFEVRNQDDKAVKNPFTLVDKKGVGHVSVLYKAAMGVKEEDITEELKLTRLNETSQQVYRKYSLVREDGKAFGHGEYIIKVKGYTSARFTITKDGLSEKDLFVNIVEDRGNLKINAVGNDYNRIPDKDFVIAKPLIKQDTRKVWVKKLVGDTIKVVEEDVVFDNVVIRDGVPQISKSDKEVYLRKTNANGSTFGSFTYSADKKGAVVTGAEDGRYNQKDYDWLVADLKEWVAKGQEVRNNKDLYVESTLNPVLAALADAEKTAKLIEDAIYKNDGTLENIFQVLKVLPESVQKQINTLAAAIFNLVPHAQSQFAREDLKNLVAKLKYDLENGVINNTTHAPSTIAKLEKTVRDYKEANYTKEAVAQAEIDRINALLDDAVNFAALQKEIKLADAIKPAYYANVTADQADALAKAIAAAKAVKVENGEKAITEAREALAKVVDPIVANGLNELGKQAMAIAEVEALDLTKYTALSAEAVKTELAKAQAKLNEILAPAKDADKDSRVIKIQNAIDKGLVKTDVADLKIEAETALTDLGVGQFFIDQIKNSKASADAIKVLYGEILKGKLESTKEIVAKEIIANNTSMIEELKALVVNLNNVVKNLKPQEKPEHVSALSAKILENFVKVYQARHDAAEGKYTKASLEELQKAINAADALLDKASATPAEFAKAFNDMEAAHRALVGLETPQIFVNYGEKLVIYPKGEPEKAQLWNPWVVAKEIKFYEDLKESAVNPHKYFRLKESDELNFFWIEDTNITLRVRIETVDEKPVRQAEVEVGLPKEYTSESVFAFGESVAKGKTDDRGYVEFTLPREAFVKLVAARSAANVLENPSDSRVVAERRYLPYLVRQLDTGIEEGVIKSDEIYNVAVDARLVAGERIYELHIRNNVDLGKETGRIGGANRYATAVAVAHKSFPKGLVEFDNHTNLVISSGENYPDSLTASTTAYNYSAPLVLTTKSELPKETLDYIKANLVGKKSPRVIIVGGAATVSDTVVNEIKGLGIDVLRISGRDRYATSVENAKALVSLAGNNHDQLMKGFRGTERKVVIASGENFPDALAIASPAAHAGYPLLLTKKDEVPAVVREFLKESNAKTADVIGGEASVSELAVKQLRDDYLNLTVARVAGSDRTETSIEIAKKYYKNATHVFVTSGAGFADALTGATYAAKEGSPVILLPNATTVSEDVVSFIKDSKITTFTILGGAGTVSEAARRTVSDTILGK